MNKTEQLIADWDIICDRIENGATVRELGKDYDCTISLFRKICVAHKELGEQYACAREAAADAFEAEIIETSRTGTGDAARDRLLTDTLKWAAARRNFKRYGDRQQVDTKHEIGEGLAERMSKAIKRIEES